MALKWENFLPILIAYVYNNIRRVLTFMAIIVFRTYLEDELVKAKIKPRLRHVSFWMLLVHSRTAPAKIASKSEIRDTVCVLIEPSLSLYAITSLAFRLQQTVFTFSQKGSCALRGRGAIVSLSIMIITLGISTAVQVQGPRCRDTGAFLSKLPFPKFINHLIQKEHFTTFRNGHFVFNCQYWHGILWRHKFLPNLWRHAFWRHLLLGKLADVCHYWTGIVEFRTLRGRSCVGGKLATVSYFSILQYW